MKIFDVLNLTKNKANRKLYFYKAIPDRMHTSFLDAKANGTKYYLDNKDYIDRLIELCLNRKIVKKSIMTFSYNASTPTLVNYLGESLKKILPRRF